MNGKGVRAMLSRWFGWRSNDSPRDLTPDETAAADPMAEECERLAAAAGELGALLDEHAEHPERFDTDDVDTGPVRAWIHGAGGEA